jgi:hypothetical protein
MYQTINKYDFTEAFKTMGRGEQFSYEGLQALFDYLEDYEESTGDAVELDVIAICCDYAEWDTAFDAAMEHGFTPDDADDKEEQEEEALEYLLDRTTVIQVGDGVIIQQF